MTDRPQIYLTSRATELVPAVAGLRPDLRVEPFAPAAFRSETGPAWVFVDWLLPDLSGLELCRRLRESETGRGLHLTMVLEDGDADTRRRALAAGADDYIIGPLTAEALIARVDGGRTGRNPLQPSVKLRHGSITVDLAGFQARHDGKLVPLRPNEFRLLVHFVEHPDQVFSRLALIEHLGKDGEEIDERTVDVWVGRLRRALRAHGVPDPLRTVRSYGYVLDSAQT